MLMQWTQNSQACCCQPAAAGAHGCLQDRRRRSSVMQQPCMSMDARAMAWAAPLSGYCGLAKVDWSIK